jgi:phenylalanyl-tRNA synthetase beta chain
VKVALDWLAEWVDLPRSLEALTERLTLAGLEIEGVERGADLPGVQVGHVLERQPHPDAERLSVCRVDAGQGEPLTVVCGAPNVRPGLRVALALPGAVLPDGTRLKRSKIRGVVSEGMICSARELGLGEEHGGILELDAAAPVGAPLAQALPPTDAVLDLEITPNRGDWASMLGIARETRAHFGGPLHLPPTEPPEGSAAAADDVSVHVEDPQGCHHYVARVVRGLRVGPSPDWLVRRLQRAGLRSLNVVVDVTNLVLLELGQPLHAFDLATLRGREVRVRAAAAGEKLVTLDGQTRELAAGDLVIADAERAIAVAGVMGGAQTEVRDRTTDVLIESAHFDPARVRRTARGLGLRTEASYRFERGVDAQGVARAADRCARLLAELAGGVVSRGRVEARGAAFAHCDEVWLDPAHPARLLGVPLPEREVVQCLARVDIEARPEGGRLRCRVPSYRNDITIAQDLIEEVGRVWGYERLEPTLPAGPALPVGVPRAIALADAARDSLRASGLLEARLLPMLAPSDPEALLLAPDDPRRRALRLLNPLVEEQSQLRTSLLPGLLRAVHRNLARQLDRIRLFEVGRVFLARAPGELPEETPWVAAVLTQAQRPRLWERESVPLFFEAKSALERLVADLGLAARFGGEPQAPYLHPGVRLGLSAGRRLVGRVGELHPQVAARFGLSVPCAVLELDLGAVAACPAPAPRYREVSPFPAAWRDLAVVVPEAQAAGEVLEAIRATGGAHLERVEVFDRYAGPGLPAGKVSLAFRLAFQRVDRTLTDAEIGQAVDRIVRMIGQRFGGELR